MGREGKVPKRQEILLGYSLQLTGCHASGEPACLRLGDISIDIMVDRNTRAAA
jgi:hypothetical protein